MSSRSAAFTTELGDWRVDVLECGRLGLDGGAMFGAVPRVVWERRIPPDERHRIPLAMRVLLLRHTQTNDVVLVDTGIGTKFDTDFRDAFAIDNPTAAGATTPLELVLRSVDVTIADVTALVLTHLHFDHAGGVTVRNEGEVVPAAPRAEHFLQRANLETARSPNPRERASYLAENFQPLEAARLTLLDGPEEILPGIRVTPSSGHTTGMQTVRVEGGGRVLRFISDLAPTSHHVHLPFTMGYDLSPRTIMDEKEAAWRQAIDEEATLVFQHDPTVVTGTVSFDGRRFRCTVGATVQ